jgi:hypothetical protein
VSYSQSLATSEQGSKGENISISRGGLASIFLQVKTKIIAPLQAWKVLAKVFFTITVTANGKLSLKTGYKTVAELVQDRTFQLEGNLLTSDGTDGKIIISEVEFDKNEGPSGAGIVRS